MDQTKCKRSAYAVETIQLPDGGRYVGQLNGEGEPHGSGTKFRADGNEVASGQWREGKLHGHGRMVFSSGSYEGDFVAGKQSLGAYTCADGLVFEGEWTDGERSGLGVESTAEGEMVRCGRWALNQLEESRPVPRSKIPIGKFLSAAGEPTRRVPHAQPHR